MDQDYLLALKLQDELEADDERSISIISPHQRKQTTPQKENHKKTSLVDPSWELIDPTPDIHALFIQFNTRFFWGRLSTVEVRWSPRMTSCAGVCVYQGRSGFCSVRLSLPLLQLRPRKDLIETLLHEMIHAYLFVTKQNRDRDGHGPDFHQHMYRINNDAGTKISVYHTFHDEVRSYQQHWWRCEGPCQKRPPFFGMVRRSMNRAPGPNDNWWAQHEATCGGRFQKIREPEDYGKKKSSKKQSSQSGKKDIRSFFPGYQPSTSQAPPGKPFQPTNPRTISPAGNKQVGGMNFPSFRKGPTIGSGVPNSPTGHNMPSGSSGNPIPTVSRPPVNKVVGFKDLGNSGNTNPVNKPSASAVNNVYGMKDLNGQGTSKPAGKRFPASFGGRGFTLGAGNSQRPGDRSPAGRGRGRGGFGGLLTNRGGGTLVLTEKSKTKGKDSHNGTSVPQPTVSVFSGEGKTLGGADQNRPKSTPPHIQSKLNPFQRNIPVFSGGNRLIPKQSVASSVPVKRSSLGETNGSEKRLKVPDIATVVIDESDDDTVEVNEVSCPVCDKKVKEEDINNHLDVCVVVPPAHSNPDDSVLISDDDNSEEDHEKADCPVCNKRLLASELEKHLNSCMADNFSDDDAFESHEGTKSDVKCPICGEEIKASDLDSHLENCAHCSVQDLSQVFEEDFSDEEEEEAAVNSPSSQVGESGERLYPCPCCMALQEESKMNEHLDVCASF